MVLMLYAWEGNRVLYMAESNGILSRTDYLETQVSYSSSPNTHTEYGTTLPCAKQY